jgi:hypothetical protein
MYGSRHHLTRVIMSIQETVNIPVLYIFLCLVMNGIPNDSFIQNTLCEQFIIQVYFSFCCVKNSDSCIHF